MKILLEMTDEGEPEIIIKCHKLTPDIIKLQQMLASYDAGNGSLNQIIFYKGDTEYYMNLNDILFFQTESSVIYAHTATDAYETKYKLYELEEILPAAFIRISKSAIVNSSLIYSIQRNLAASSVISFNNTHKEVYVSRAYYKMLKNKIALITGAGRGIGRAIAIALAKEGAEVVINYNGSEERAKEVKQTIEENGGKASIYKCNVSDFTACEAMIKDIVKEYGHLDILVNNAGITKDGLIMKMKEEDFDSVLNVNLKGTFNTIRHSARQMLKQRSGKIINISSVSGILGNVGQANYAASKAGVIGLTKTMARELGSRGITVNAIAPGFVDTEMTEVLSEEIRENACKQIILGRFGKPEDIANTAVFLASDKADYITGQVISVDGGMNV